MVWPTLGSRTAKEQEQELTTVRHLLSVHVVKRCDHGVAKGGPGGPGTPPPPNPIPLKIIKDKTYVY